MNLRKYIFTDNEKISDMLIAEGIPDKDMKYKEYETFVMEGDDIIKGFFTIKQEWGYPSIQHFCINREYRSAKMARELAKAMKNTIKDKGFSNLILHSKSNVLDKFISYYFKKKPYSIEGITTFYFVSL